MKLRILGCGTSSGVPRIGGDWGDCDPADPRNRRLRTSALVETATTRILIDTGPDLREQLLAAEIDRVDAILWTHDHADHINGIDDVRQLAQAAGGPVRAFARPPVLSVVTSRFGYVFEGTKFYPPTIRAEPLPDRLAVGDLTIEVVDQPHGAIQSAGLVFSDGTHRFGYATDFSDLTPAMAAAYRACDLWVADALRRYPHPTHPTLDQVLGWHRMLETRRTLLIHMDNSMDYTALLAELPDGVEPAYDGMEVTA